MRGDQTPEESSLTRAVIVGSRCVAFQIRATGTMKQPRVKYALFSKDSLSTGVREAVVDRITFFLSLDDDLGPFYRIAREDHSFAPVLERLYGLHHVKFLTPFESACWSILSGHNRISVALKTKRVLVQKYGGRVEVDGHTYYAFPEPSALAEASKEDLHELVRNHCQADYLVALGKAFANVDEKFLRTADYDIVEGWLRRIKGMGERSAKLVLLRGLGRMEKLVVEKRLLAAAAMLYGEGVALTPARFNEAAARYGSWKGYWAYYLRASSGP